MCILSFCGVPDGVWWVCASSTMSGYSVWLMLEMVWYVFYNSGASSLVWSRVLSVSFLLVFGGFRIV